VHISALDVTLVSVPLRRTFGGSSYAADRRNTIIVELSTDDGVAGRIHAGDERHGLAELGRIIRDDIRPVVLGRPATAIEDCWRALLRRSPAAASSVDQRLYMHALSAVDTALWDALGKRARLPLHRLWGGSGASLPAIVIGGYYEHGKTLDDLAAEVEGYRAAGFGGIKLKVGGLSPRAALERRDAVRARVGGDFMIACDANQGWTLAEAEEFARGAADYGIRWFEEPIVWYDQYRDLRRLRERTAIPVCAGQSELSPAGAARLVTDGCVDILNFDASWGGGPTGWRKVAQLAELHGVALAHHEEPQVSSHLLTTVSDGLAVEFFHAERDPVWHAMLVDAPPITAGRVAPSERPGLGLEFDPDFVARYRVG
jgi:D-galactarolactone cycloisomerase